MGTDRKSIAQIRQEFDKAKEHEWEGLIGQYQMDERSGRRRGGEGAPS